MSNQIEQIRAEIERLIKQNAEHPKDEITADVYEYALQDVLEILDKYEQAHPVPTDVQEDKAAMDYYLNLPNSSYGEGGNLLPCSINDAFKAGIDYERERLMKEAVEGTLGYGPHLLRPIVMLEQVPKIWDGSSSNPVSVIIIKKEK